MWGLVSAGLASAQVPQAGGQSRLALHSASGLRLLVATESTQPALRIVLPGRDTSDRSITVLFPEHVTAVPHGTDTGRQLYMFRPWTQGAPPVWRRTGQLASETPARLSMPLEKWLPARYLVSYRWPVPAQRVEDRGDGITYYNKSRAVDVPFIATRSTDTTWVVASFTRDTGNVWSNPALTCQHVDPQASVSPGGRAVREVKILVIHGTLGDALERATRQRPSLK